MPSATVYPNYIQRVPEVLREANWHREQDGRMSIVFRGLKLMVCMGDNCARYLIEQCADGSKRQETLLESGTESTLAAAMAAAMQAAIRIQSMLVERGRVPA